MFEAIRRLFRKDYPTSLLLISVAIGTVVFSIGQLLEPSAKHLLLGDADFFSWLLKFRTETPGTLVLTLFVSGLFPAIITGLMVVKGNSLIHRLKYAVFWAPVSLILLDTVAYFVQWMLNEPLSQLSIGIAFSLLANVFGGIVGGLTIGLAVHLCVEMRYKGRLGPSGLTTRSTATRKGSARRQRGR